MCNNILVDFRSFIPGKIRDEFLTQIAMWCNDHKNFPALRSHLLTSPDLQRDWFQSIIKSEKDQYYFIYMRGDMVGYCGLDKINHYHKTAEISLLIGTEFQERSYGRIAVETLLRIGFITFDLNCIYAEVNNITEAPIFWSKCGFKKEGVLRSRKRWNSKATDVQVRSILKSEWEDLYNQPTYLEEE